MCMATEGPSLPEMEYILNTTTSGLSVGLAGNSAGYLVGCFIFALTFDRGAQDLQLAVVGLVMAVASVLPPFSGSLSGYIGTLIFKGLTFGCMGPGKFEFYLV